MSEGIKIARQPEWDALYAFDAENNVLPARTIAEKIAERHGLQLWYSLVDEISHAIEDAMELGIKRGPLIPPLTGWPGETLNHHGGREKMNLTAKQQRVCDLVVRGLSNKEIAEAVGISARTVESHRLVIFNKTGVRNAVELTRKMLGAS